MKRLKTVGVIALLLLSSCAHTNKEKWTQATYVSFGAMIAAAALDSYQTVQIQNDPDMTEGNALMASNPTTPQVILFMTATKLALYGVSFLLPNDWRVMLFSMSAGGHAACVWHNAEQGL